VRDVTPCAAAISRCFRRFQSLKMRPCSVWLGTSKSLRFRRTRCRPHCPAVQGPASPRSRSRLHVEMVAALAPHNDRNAPTTSPPLLYLERRFLGQRHSVGASHTSSALRENSKCGASSASTATTVPGITGCPFNRKHDEPSARASARTRTFGRSGSRGGCGCA
jgi:hypothetical protein